MNTTADRAQQLNKNLNAVTERIRLAAAADRAPGITPYQPELIVVTKFHPASDVLALRELGVADVGENRDQEAAAKAAEVAGAAGAGLRWHFIGQLQTNKAKSVVKYAHSVHSVDRLSLAKALATAMATEQAASGREDLRCYIQVSLDPDAVPGGGPAGRGGAAPADVEPIAAYLEQSPGLVLAGVMAVAPLGEDPDAAFERLAGISASLVAKFPAATAISAGMSQDLEAAIRWGATHLRVGSDVLGPRPALR